MLPGCRRVGNAAFSDAFKYLVGTSYQAVYGADPVPSQPRKLLFQFTPVHGSVFMDGSTARGTAQPPLTFKVEDHNVDKCVGVGDSAPAAQRRPPAMQTVRPPAQHMRGQRR